jgi:hypothetical protein
LQAGWSNFQQNNQTVWLILNIAIDGEAIVYLFQGSFLLCKKFAKPLLNFLTGIACRGIVARAQYQKYGGSDKVPLGSE